LAFKSYPLFIKNRLKSSIQKQNPTKQKFCGVYNISLLWIKIAIKERI